MAAKKTADLSSSLLAVKGTAGVQGLEDAPTKPAQASAPLNFKVDPAFRRRFRQRAADADLKLNALLREALLAWEKSRGLVTDDHDGAPVDAGS